MKQLVGILALLTLTSQTFAAEVKVPGIVLDKIQFEMSSKQWVTTQKAILSVSINATLNNADLVKARADIMTRLNKIVKGDWHLVAFDRSQDSSGLEKLSVQAQARVDQTDLTDIYQNAKSVSAPGAKYEISGVEFKPGLEEIQEVRAQIREQLYQKVTEEMARINKIYPNQNYSLKHLVFVEGEGPMPQQRAYRTKTINAMATADAGVSPLSVSNELILTAVVEAASNRKKEN